MPRRAEFGRAEHDQRRDAAMLTGGEAAVDQIIVEARHRRDHDHHLRDIGGDEFLLLLNNIQNQQDASAFAAKLAETLAQPYLLTQGAVSLTASIGIACYPADGDNAQVLIRHADTAMYQAKQQPKGDAWQQV